VFKILEMSSYDKSVQNYERSKKRKTCKDRTDLKIEKGTLPVPLGENVATASTSHNVTPVSVSFENSPALWGSPTRDPLQLPSTLPPFSSLTDLTQLSDICKEFMVGEPCELLDLLWQMVLDRGETQLEYTVPYFIAGQPWRVNCKTKCYSSTAESIILDQAKFLSAAGMLKLMGITKQIILERRRVREIKEQEQHSSPIQNLTQAVPFPKIQPEQFRSAAQPRPFVAQPKPFLRQMNTLTVTLTVESDEQGCSTHWPPCSGSNVQCGGRKESDEHWSSCSNVQTQSTGKKVKVKTSVAEQQPQIDREEGELIPADGTRKAHQQNHMIDPLTRALKYLEGKRKKLKRRVTIDFDAVEPALIAESISYQAAWDNMIAKSLQKPEPFLLKKDMSTGSVVEEETIEEARCPMNPKCSCYVYT